MIRQYLDEAMSRARITQLDDGSYAGEVPGLPGVIATGVSQEACRTTLEEVIEEWVLVRVSRGLEVPAIGGAIISVREVL